MTYLVTPDAAHNAAATNNAFDRLLDAIERAGFKITDRKATTARAQCPAHGGNGQNLSIFSTDTRVNAVCHSRGCDLADVLAAVGLTIADRYHEPPQRTRFPGFRASATYAYDDGRTVYRAADKGFRQDTPAGGSVTLYRAGKVAQAAAQSAPVLLVEGEEDVHAAEAIGAVATTAPMGSGNFSKVDVSPFAGAPVVAVVDADEQGQKWAAQVAERVGPIAKSLRFVRAAEGKDLSDHLTAGHTLADLVPVSDTSDTSDTTSQGAESNLLARIRTGDQLDAAVFPPLAWAVPGLIPEGFGLFTGPPKVGKSWCVLGLALAVACGGRALGKVPVGAPRPVLYLALEDGERRLQSRCRHLLAGEPIPPKLHYITAATPNEVLEIIPEWLDMHAGADPLVILDTLGKVMPPSLPGEGAYQRDYRIGSRLKLIVDARPGSTLLVVHHVRKQAGEDWMDSTSGTNGLNGSADFTINLSRGRNDDAGVIRVTGRDVPENEYAVTNRDGAWHLDGAELVEAARKAEQVRVAAGLGDRSAEVLAEVRKHPGGVRAGEIAQALGMEPNDAGTYLRRLARRGSLVSPSRGLFKTVSEVSEVSDCTVCRFPLPSALADAGETTHPTCDPEGTES